MNHQCLQFSHCVPILTPDLENMQFRACSQGIGRLAVTFELARIVSAPVLSRAYELTTPVSASCTQNTHDRL